MMTFKTPACCAGNPRDRPPHPPERVSSLCWKYDFRWTLTLLLRLSAVAGIPQPNPEEIELGGEEEENPEEIDLEDEEEGSQGEE